MQRRKDMISAKMCPCVLSTGRHLLNGKVELPIGLTKRFTRTQTPISHWFSGLTVRQVRVREAANHKCHKATVYATDSDGTSWKSIENVDDDDDDASKSPKVDLLLTALQENVITYFLPARYPESVTPGYSHYAGFCFCASIAGSAAMVLSTQTLLLAVGVVGSSSSQTQASIMAGALNRVLKDGIGQLGGVWFASRMSQAGSAKFDADPKRWRMVAALSLDGATLLEIMSPLVPSTWVLPIASVANVGKNIGFLTASASRAALHQSLAIRGNLADLTAKAGSQSLAASLIGTALGIGLSPILGDVVHYAFSFVCLSAIHQSCTYLSLKAVPLFNLNRHRLNIIIDEFVKSDTILSPSQVAEKENFLPILSRDDSKRWLRIGGSLPMMCPGGPEELRCLLEVMQAEQYLVNFAQDNIHLVFKNDCTGEDLIRGMLHAHILHQHDSVHNLSETITTSYDIAQRKSDGLLEGMKKMGWKTGTEFTSVESSKAYRLTIVES